MDEYNLTQREKRVIMDEVRGKTGNARALRPPVEAAKVDHRKTNPKSSYLELLRCGGKMKSNGEASRYATRLDHFIFEKIMADAKSTPSYSSGLHISFFQHKSEKRC